MLWRKVSGAGAGYKADPEFNLDRMSESGRQTDGASFYDGLSFSSDGTEGFMHHGGSGDVSLDPFTCSAYALDVTLGGNTIINVSSYTSGAIRGAFSRKDGLRVFFGDSGGALNSIDLSVAWDPTSTITHNQEKFSVITGSLSGIHFLDDGMTFYGVGYDSATAADVVRRYTLTTAWDLSTAALGSTDSSVVDASCPTPRGIWVDENEDWLFVVDQNTGDLYSFSIPADGDMSNLSFSKKYDQASTFSCQDFDLKPDGTKLFQIDGTSDDLIQYTFS